MKAISAVEYLVNGSIICNTTQLQIEEAVMKENAIYFSLACSSPVFSINILQKLGMKGQTKKVRDLIRKNILVVTKNEIVN